MINQKLNDKVCRYQTTGDEHLFNEIYREVAERWFSKPEGDAKFAATDVSEVCAMYDDTFMKVVGTYRREKGNFTHMLRASIYNAKCDLREKCLRRRQMEIYEGDDQAGDDSAATLEYIAGDYSAEDYALESIHRERDQRQLISSLVAQADDFTQKIVQLLPSYDFSVTALGKALGVHHSKVSRAISRLSRHYDYSRFGDISDYMTA